MAILMRDSSTLKLHRKLYRVWQRLTSMCIRDQAYIKLDDISKNYVSWSTLDKNSNHRVITAQLMLCSTWSSHHVPATTWCGPLRWHNTWLLVFVLQYYFSVILVLFTISYRSSFCSHVFHGVGTTRSRSTNFQPPPTDPTKPPPRRRPRFVPVYPAHVLAAVPPPGPPFKRPKWLPLPEQSSQK
jgi:hypothetical protein